VANLLALAKVIEARDPHACGHAARVAALADAVAGWLAWDDDQRAVLRLGGELHDIGKLCVPERVLGKPGPLDDEERALVRRHPRAGASMVWAVKSLRPAIPGVLYHHERWDGTGYPTGRAEEQIPEEARLIALADAFDAITSDRPNRPALPPDRALDELRRAAGGQFDPELTSAFVEAWEAGELTPSRPLAVAC